MRERKRSDCCFYAIPWPRRAQLLVHTFSSDVSVEIAIAITVALVQFFNGFRNFYYFFMCIVVVVAAAFCVCVFVCPVSISLLLVFACYFIPIESADPFQPSTLTLVRIDIDLTDGRIACSLFLPVSVFGRFLV